MNSLYSGAGEIPLFIDSWIYRAEQKDSVRIVLLVINHALTLLREKITLNFEITTFVRTTPDIGLLGRGSVLEKNQ